MMRDDADDDDDTGGPRRSHQPKDDERLTIFSSGGLCSAHQARLQGHWPGQFGRGLQRYYTKRTVVHNFHKR